MTFDRNPLAVIRPDRCPENVVTVDRKLELLSELGLDATLVLTFDETLAARSAEDFVVDILVGALHVSTVLVGADFRFGHRGAGTPELLRALGPATASRSRSWTTSTFRVPADGSRRAGSASC